MNSDQCPGHISSQILPTSVTTHPHTLFLSSLQNKQGSYKTKQSKIASLWLHMPLINRQEAERRRSL